MLNEIELLLLQHEKVNLKANLIDIDVQQDLFMFSQTVNLLLVDNNKELMETLQYGDKLVIEYKDTYYKPRYIETYIYDLKESNQNNTRLLKVKCCDKVLLKRPYISKQMNDIAIGNCVKELLQDYCQCDTTLLDIEQGLNAQIKQVTFSNMKPIECISKVCSDYVDENATAGVIFFQRHDIDKEKQQNRYCVSNIANLYNKGVICSYNLMGMETKRNVDYGDNNNKYFDILNYKLIKKSNVFALENTSVKGEIVNQLDLFNHKYSKGNSDNSATLNQHDIYTDINTENKKRTLTFISDKDVRHETIGKRKEILSRLIHGNKIIAEIVPNNLLSVGDVINIDSYINSKADSTQGNEINVKENEYSGKYLITAIRQKLTGFSMRMSVELTADSREYLNE